MLELIERRHGNRSRSVQECAIIGATDERRYASRTFVFSVDAAVITELKIKESGLSGRVENPELKTGTTSAAILKLGYKLQAKAKKKSGFILNESK